MAEPAINLYQVAEIQVVYRNACKPSQRPQILRSKDAFELLMQSWDENKIEFIEQAKVILLNKSNRVLGISEISSGGVSGTIVDPKVVFVTALKANASSILLAHNHPSGNLKPSEQDKRLTEKFIEASKFLDIRFIDHLIVSTEGYYSFGDDATYRNEQLPLVTLQPLKNSRPI